MRFLVVVSFVFLFNTSFVVLPEYGDVIDKFDGIEVYYNGRNFTRTSGRNVAADGYNFGLRYQCVEFVKRYYYYRFNHKMPNSFGHAKDFFDYSLGDVGYNQKRGLKQYRNIRSSLPQPRDILVYGPGDGNPYGHIAIVSAVNDDEIEIVQQNYGLETRKKIKIARYMDIITVADYNVLGWLRKD